MDVATLSQDETADILSECGLTVLLTVSYGYTHDLIYYLHDKNPMDTQI